MITIINLTPHPITIVTETGNLTIAPTAPAVRCVETIATVGKFNGIAVIQKKMGDLENLPNRKPETVFVVSLAAAAKAWEAGRTDVLAIGESVRDEQGRITGCKSLASSPEGVVTTDDAGNRYFLDSEGWQDEDM